MSPSAAANGWPAGLLPANCASCDWYYFAPDLGEPAQCPHCGRVELTPLGKSDGLPYTRPPEQVLPFSITTAQVAANIALFARGIPYAPEDLAPDNLTGRLVKIFLPQWLVDIDVTAAWTSEMGFNYEAVSHREIFKNGAWRTFEVKEARVRWEPRVGQLQRTYHNVPAPALEEERELQERLGEFDLGQSVEYKAEQVDGVLIRLPNRPPRDAWSDAAPRVQSAAEAECRQAAAADHSRSFRWQPRYANQNWTELLLPVFATYYLDDDDVPQMILLNGQTGRLSGDRRSSLKRARRAALIYGAVAAVIGIVALLLGLVGIALPPLLVPAGIGLLLALAAALGAVYPLYTASSFNREQERRRRLQNAPRPANPSS